MTQENLPIWKRRLVSNDSSAPPAWTTHVQDQKFYFAPSFPQLMRPAVRKFSFRIACGAGVLMHGACDDFLACVLIALEKKMEWSSRLSDSVLRVQLFYPNGQRVPKSELSAVLSALADPKVSADIARRRVAAAQNSPARSEARTAEFLAAGGPGLAVAVDVAFSQAGVVAPPDSPDLGNSVISPFFGLGN